jgi:ceramide glucosyltransferase
MVQRDLGAKAMVQHIFYWLVLVLAAAPVAYYLLSLYCAVRYFREARNSSPSVPQFAPPASILKPVRGLDHQAYENFASYCRLDYPEYEIIFAVAEADDPVVPVIERLQSDFPHRSIRLIRGVAQVGANRKVNSLCRLAHEARYDLLVMTDSDVRVETDYLKEVAAPFADPHVGAVTSFYRCITNGCLATNLSALGMCLNSAPGALVARRLEKQQRFAYGWTMATTKQILAEIGGWEAMANYHSDDFELGNRIARRGYRVELMPKPIHMVLPRGNLKQYLQHQLRWSIGLKNVRPAGYRAMLLTHGLPWALAAALVSAHEGWKGVAAAYLFLYLALRLILGWTVGVWGLGDARVAKKLWLVPLHDALDFVAWVGGLFSDKIIWRGLTYRVRKGQLELIPERTSIGASMAHGISPRTAVSNKSKGPMIVREDAHGEARVKEPVVSA